MNNWKFLATCNSGHLMVLAPELLMVVLRGGTLECPSCQVGQGKAGCKGTAAPATKFTDDVQFLKDCGIARDEV